VLIDLCLGGNVQKDFIDLTKIMVGITAIIPNNFLKEKIGLYHSNDILAFPGGQFLELMFSKNQIDNYFNDVVNVGFKLVEVSDNRIDITPQEKSNLIKMVRQEYG